MAARPNDQTTQRESVAAGRAEFPSDSMDQTVRAPAHPGIELSQSAFAALLALPPNGPMTKQERNFILAALLMRGKHLGERTLRRVLRSWTPFGELSLREFLVRKGLVTEQTLAQVDIEGQQFVQSLEQRNSWNDGPPTAARRTSSLLERIDPGGRVAKVFGLSQIPKEVIGDEFRTFRTKYRLLHKLGQGGLGTVWLAIDTSLNRLVAIKEILGSADHNPIAVARFRREAEITGRLDHPSIVPLHVLGENEADGRQFYVMRFLGNETLEDAIRDYHERREIGQAAPMGLHRLLVAFGSICQAIAYAHSRHVIHRDLKPQNIALDNFGQVIILDWGLAKILSTGEVERQAPETTVDSLDVTVAGHVTGTPMYMAPEQAAGRVDDIDEQTDVYGLGAILFSILTGYAPHEQSHESLAAGSQMGALLDAIVDRPVTSPRRLNSEIPPVLAAICLKALAKDRYQRYPSASALAEDFQRWMANEPVTAIREPVFSRMGRWIRKHQYLSWLLTVMGMLLLSLGAFGAFESYQRRETREQLQLHVVAGDTRDLQAKLAHEIQVLSEIVRFLSTEPAVQDLVEARVHHSGSDESKVAARLTRIFQGVMDVHPSSVAVTFGINDPVAIGKPIRVQSREALHRGFRSDFKEFLSRHYPAIKNLDRGNVYIGMPGRFSANEVGKNEQDRATSSAGDVVGRCLVAGTQVYDDKSEARVGALVIECDLEKMLREYCHTAFHKNLEITLTDQIGHGVMRYTSDEGLVPVESRTRRVEDELLASSFFQSRSGTVVKIDSSRLAFAKVPMSQANSSHFMGLILRFAGPDGPQ